MPRKQPELPKKQAESLSAQAEPPKAQAKNAAENHRFKSTADIPVPEKLIGQVLGQDNCVDIIKKAAVQRRNVLLIGVPGTGKSMLAQAMAEIMPVQQLHDVIVHANEADPNTPKVRVLRAGEGRKEVEKTRLDAKAQDDNMRMLGMLLPFMWFLLSVVIWHLGWISDVVFAATLLLGGVLMIGFALATQIKPRSQLSVPKLLIDNVGKKVAPFIEATGARAGALLGDVRHDPLQSLIDEVKFVVCRNGIEEKLSFEQLWSEMLQKYPHLVEKYKDGYEAMVFPEEEQVFAYGLNDKKEIAKARIYSMNRRPYDGEVVEISAGERKVTVTPEHKVLTEKGDKEAGELSKKDNLFMLVKAELAKVFG